MQLIHIYKDQVKLTHWGVGEWVEEPDRANFIHQGITCLVERFVGGIHFEAGQFNGYIILQPDHPWFGKEYDEICSLNIDIHGGITYSEGNSENWMIGFDCAHSCDITPGVERIMKEIRERLRKNYGIINSTYKNITFAIEECKKLSDQAAASLMMVKK